MARCQKAKYVCRMTPDIPSFAFDPEAFEQLAQIVDRARFDNGVRTGVSRVQLSSDLTRLYQDSFAADIPTLGDDSVHWDMIAEETPTPTRQYKIFAKALIANDPLAKLRTLSQGRSPSELYLLEVRIKSFARSRRATIDQVLPDLKNAAWDALSDGQQATIRKHMSDLETHYYKTQKRNTVPMENRINLAVHDLAELFARHTGFDSIPTDLPYAATSRFVQFLCLALRPLASPTKLSPEAVSKRWMRLRGLSFRH
jgi:hypothetical protein